jgi:hypothetical protein
VSARITHKCPYGPCDRQVDRAQFACRNHWYWLPKDLRDAIWGSYRSGDTGAHMEAMSDAIDWYGKREAEAAKA